MVIVSGCKVGHTELSWDARRDSPRKGPCDVQTYPVVAGQDIDLDVSPFPAKFEPFLWTKSPFHIQTRIAASGIVETSQLCNVTKKQRSTSSLPAQRIVQCRCEDRRRRERSCRQQSHRREGRAEAMCCCHAIKTRMRAIDVLAKFSPVLHVSVEPLVVVATTYLIHSLENNYPLVRKAYT